MERVLFITELSLNLFVYKTFKNKVANAEFVSRSSSGQFCNHGSMKMFEIIILKRNVLD